MSAAEIRPLSHQKRSIYKTQSFEIGSRFPPLESERRAYALSLLERSLHLSSDRPAPSVGSGKDSDQWSKTGPADGCLACPEKLAWWGHSAMLSRIEGGLKCREREDGVPAEHWISVDGFSASLDRDISFQYSRIDSTGPKEVYSCPKAGRSSFAQPIGDWFLYVKSTR